MNYLLIPISNLLLDTVIKLKDMMILPCYFEDGEKINFDYDINEEEQKVINSLIEFNNQFVIKCGQYGINLALLKIETDIDSIDNINIFVESKIYTVHRSLDFIRIQYCNFNNKETLVGITGLINNTRKVFYWDCSLQSIKEIECNPILHSMQPGIGLDLCSPGLGWKDKEFYPALFSDRQDEVYLEIRTIIGRACEAMNIIDINRCFCYLFSTVERMGGTKYCKFETRKKKIISFISKDQEEFNRLSKQLFFYSKKVRTDIIHKGKNILDMIPITETSRIINSLYLLIIRFTLKVINANICTFNELDEILNEAIEKYQYATPTLPTTDYVLENFLDYDSDFTFIAPIENLHIRKIMKLGNTLLIPRNSIDNFDNYCWVYTLYENGEDIDFNGSITTPNNKVIELNEFKDLCDEDIIALQSALCCKEISELNRKTAFSISFGQPFLEDIEYSPNKYFEFCDYLCSNINKELNYIVLSLADIRNVEYLPSQVGILEGYRVLYRLHNYYHIVQNIPGRVYRQYNGGNTQFAISDDFEITDRTLYDCLYNYRKDEISYLCKIALNRLCECYYINDYTLMISYMFDILDMLDPQDTDGKQLKSHVLPFVCDSKQEYHQACNTIKIIRNKYRNPLVHNGKSIYDIISKEDEIYEVFDYLKSIIISFCKKVFLSGVTNFDELEEEREKIKKSLKL